MDKRENVAEITYAVDKDGELYIDILITDFSKETLDKFSALYASIPSVQFQTQALEIIKDAFFEEGKIEEFTAFATEALVKSKLLFNHQDEEMDEMEESDEEKVVRKSAPLIRPSDLT